MTILGNVLGVAKTVVKNLAPKPTTLVGGTKASTPQPLATNPATTPTAQAPTPAKAPEPAPFNFNYNYMDYNTAQNQAAQQFNPLYEQAVKNISAQEAQNEVVSGENSAARGIAHSGLASDALNKLKIAAQGQIADANAQRNSQVAALAQQLMQQDQQRGDNLYNRAYQQYRDSIGDQRYTDETTYNHGRDTLSDKRYDSETAYSHGRDAIADTRYTDEKNYNRGRDKIADQRYNSETAYNHGRDKVTDSQWNKQFGYTKAIDNRNWNQMSPAEKQQMALSYSYSQKGKKPSGGGGGGGGSSKKTTKSKSTSSYPSKLTPGEQRVVNTINYVYPKKGKQTHTSPSLNSPNKLAGY